ncbi:prolyl aminopeptidase [Ampullimonas aquatilis]|uniref:prolyl aminopeptidase n=1 Tax=Ampullimonas aquatilis TaxID=1341549 RepID=UPI003C78818F
MIANSASTSATASAASSAPSDSPLSPLFPALEPYDSGYLALDNLHEMYWEVCGNPQGVPVVFLHGGPGGGCSAASRQFFDPAYYRIVLFDQRGAGKSLPFGEICQNTTAHLVNDIERLRDHLGIHQWLVFGGSWGSTLALAYGQTHPARCLGFILRGIFLIRQSEIDWFLYGMGQFFPEAWQAFTDGIPDEERGDILAAYADRLFDDKDPVGAQRWAQIWSRYEGSCANLLPAASAATAARMASDEVALALARLECHYMQHTGFIAEGQLLENLSEIAHLPAIIVQGRYDMVCPPSTAWELHMRWPGSQLVMVPDAGHSAFEPGNCRALVTATEAMKSRIS